MEVRKWLTRIPILPLLITVSFFVGWFVPDYYEWTGSDQSRPSPLVGQTALGMIAGAVFVGEYTHELRRQRVDLLRL